MTIKGYPMRLMRLMRLSRAAVLAVLLGLVLTACVPGNVQPSPDETAAVNDAVRLTRQGQFDQAAQAYLALASRSSARSDHYRLLAAEDWWQAGKIQSAAPTLAKIQRDRLSGDQPLRFDLLRAELALSQHDGHTALRLTTQPNVVPSPALQLRLLELRAQAMAAVGDDWGSARTRVQMDAQLSGFDRSQNRQQIISLLTKVGVQPLQQRAAAMKPGDPMLTWVNETLTRAGVTVAQAQPDLQQPVGTLLPGADANVREGYKVTQHIALLLPDDGRFTGPTKSVREGFFAAYFDAGRNHAPRPSVKVYNSHGTADGAVAGYQQAIKDGAQLVVGPLTRTEVAAVFAQPDLPVPLLALNHPDDGKLPGGGSSEFGLLPETEGAQAADHMIERGLTHAWVLISGDDFARRAADAFRAEFTARGGQVAGLKTFTDFNNRLQGLDFAGDNSAGDSGIFISMRPQQARLLMPQLLIANNPLPVFATSHVYAGSDDPMSDRDLDGIEFCDAPWLFDAQPGLPNHNAIAAQLPAATGVGARLFAFGMDAWSLVPYLGWLDAHPGSYLPGASGQLAADQFGRIRRVLIWAKFDNGVARPLGGSLQMDDVPANVPVNNGLPAPASSAPANPATGGSAG